MTNRVSKRGQGAYDSWVRTSGKANEALSRSGAVSNSLYAAVQRALKLAFIAGRYSAKTDAAKEEK